MKTLEIDLDALIPDAPPPDATLPRRSPASDKARFESYSAPIHSLTIISTFTNLRSLIIHNASTRSSPLPAPSTSLLHTLSQCHFPSLTYLGSPYSLNDTLHQRFLSSHPSLLSLLSPKSHSLSFGMPTSFPPTLLPKLDEVDGHWSNVVRLVRGRPVRAVVVRSANTQRWLSMGRLDSVLKIMGEEKGKENGGGVVRLCVYVKVADENAVKLIAKNLPGLAALTLIDASESEDRGGNYNATEDMTRTLGVAEALGRFENLREFSVDWRVSRSRADGGDNNGAVAVGEAVEAKEHVLILGEVVPSLCRVAVFNEVWVRQNVGDDWTREA